MHVVIIGNGISGITAARWIRKLSKHRITVISSESDYFFSRTALMYIYMGHMTLKDIQPYEDHFWTKNRIDLKRAHVEDIHFSDKRLQFSSGEELEFDKLILALGSKPNKFGWPGQALDGVRGLYSLQDLEYMENHSSDLKRAVIVGGGLIGVEMAEMFHSRHIPVSILVRENEYWDNVLPSEEASMVSRHIGNHGIDLRLSSNLDEILPDDNGRVRAVRVKESQEIIECGYVGLTAGVSPNVDFLKDSELEIDKGILVDNNLKTNLDSVFAIGDCAQLRSPSPGRGSIEAIWYTGRMMGEVAAYNICGKDISYDPGFWFNSAKFFDLEYQVYGSVPPGLEEGMDSFYWEDRALEKALRIVFNSETEAVIGFNLLGIRFRQEVCAKWLREKASLEDVMRNIHLALFDPEFSPAFTVQLIKAYNDRFQRKLSPGLKPVYDRVFNFLKS